MVLLEAVFEFLFKYRPLVFGQGELALGVSRAGLVIVLGAGAAIAIALWSYGWRGGGASPRDRAVLAGLRVAALGLLLICLFRPMLVLSTVVPQQNFVGVVIDDSRSMSIADLDGAPRASFVDDAFLAEDAPVEAALSDRFALRFFRFSQVAERLDDPTQLGFDGSRTHVGAALERAHAELDAVPLAGLVLVTDGADNSGTALSEPLSDLRAAGVPVFSVGVGREAFNRDIEVSGVEKPRSVLKGTSLVVELLVNQRGYDDRTVTVHVEEDGRIVAMQDVELPSGGSPAPVRVRFTADDPGARRFRFRIPVQEGEELTENNTQETVIAVQDREEKILYFEGEPRSEIAFLRRALAADENVRPVVLLRMAEDRFTRFDVDDDGELPGGFPTSREELFSYRAVILGSVAASFFTADQQRMLTEFVDRRGGSLLMLGGRRAFTEGGWASSPVAGVLPVVLEPGIDDGGDPIATELSIVPARAGAGHPALQIAETEQASAERWESMPPVMAVNVVRQVKPGATTLLRADTPAGERVVLAQQRYGRGNAFAFPVQNFWMWRMHADIPLDDRTHDIFWQQLLRWLVNGVPDPITVTLPVERVEPGESAPIEARVEDETFLAMNDARVVARITSPSGEETEVPLDWTVERDGEYRGSFTAEEQGIHQVVAEIVDEEEDADVRTSAAAYLDASPGTAELFDAAMRAPLLRRIAGETGGRFYTPVTIGSLAEDITYTGGGTTLVEENDLWDMPIIFLLLAGLVATEWGYRRKRGLA